MYELALSLHSILRWLVLGLALLVVLRGLRGVIARAEWSEVDESGSRLFSISLDVQMLIGLVLYGLLSPITRSALADMAGAMKEPVLRFWAVEHVSLMLVAVAFAHIGRARARKATTAMAKHRASLLFTALAFVAVLAAIPWPWLAVGRPLVRMF